LVLQTKKGHEPSLTAATAKQSPGVQDGETGIRKTASDAIANPLRLIGVKQHQLARKISPTDE
jgi:hypothetical protein